MTDDSYWGDYLEALYDAQKLYSQHIKAIIHNVYTKPQEYFHSIFDLLFRHFPSHFFDFIQDDLVSTSSDTAMTNGLSTFLQGKFPFVDKGVKDVNKRSSSSSESVDRKVSRNVIEIRGNVTINGDWIM